MAALDVRYRGNRLTAFGSALSNGEMRVYAGLRPSDIAVSPFGNNLLLGVVPFTVFYADVGAGESVVNNVDTSNIAAIRTGIMRWARLVTSGGVAVMDLDITDSPEGLGVVVHSVEAVAGAPLFPSVPPSMSAFGGLITEGSVA